MTHRSILAIASLSLVLAGCSSGTPPADTGAAASASASAAASVRETPNVSYQGILEPAAPSVMMQGTHQLRLSDGRVILLESRDIVLGDYLGKKVGVFGAVRPTVEGGGVIMRVEEVLKLEEDSSSSEMSSDQASSAETESSSTAPASAASAAAPASKAAASVAAKSSAAPAPVASSAGASAGSDVSADVTARANAMAKDNMAASNWTQQYCTSHIGFCVSVHRNWWFKSFGTTTSNLWHVEVSNAEIQNLGEGPIILRLLNGSSTSDGKVLAQGSSVTGYKDWGTSQHFEITAPANLQTAVEYMIDHIVATPAQ